MEFHEKKTSPHIQRALTEHTEKKFQFNFIMVFFHVQNIQSAAWKDENPEKEAKKSIRS